jgi:hypothetical protein
MKVFRSISAILLVFLVLVSSTSFIIGMHLCMGEIQNIAFFSKADGCPKEQSLPPCHRHTTAPCCEDETVIHKGNDFKASIAQPHILVQPPVEIEQPLVLVSEIIPTAPIARIQYYNYDPPLRSCNFTIQYQVFLI